MQSREYAKTSRYALPILCGLILLGVSPGYALIITQAEYFWDTDPGVGNGMAISLTDVNTDSAYATFEAPAGPLVPGLHKLYVRYLDSEGYWSRAEGRWIFVFSPWTSDYHATTITQAEYYIDTSPAPGDGTPIMLTGAGTDSAFAAFELPEAGSLTPGLHKVYVRYRSDLGLWGGSEGRFYYLFVPWTSDYLPLVVTHVEYYFDNLPPTVIDVADAESASLEALVSSAGLDFGVHRFYVRYRDNRGITSSAEGRYGYIVSPQPTPFVADYLAGGEYWVETDPGIGNGTPFSVSADSATFHAGGFSLGPHLIGVRFYDAFGVWTPTIQDTVIAGPVLMVHRSGNSIVLDWIPGDSSAGRPFHIWRANSSEGPFAEVDTTSNLTWTDEGAVDSAATRRFYHIRQTAPE